jgi:mediator of RNA polymerase II transcription subunit 14
MQDHMAIQEPALAEGRRTPMVNVPSAIEAMLIGHCLRLTRFLEDVGSQNKLSTHEDKYALPKLDVSMLYKVLLTPLFYLKSIIAK